MYFILVKISNGNSWKSFVSDIAVFVLKRDIKLQLTNSWKSYVLIC